MPSLLLSCPLEARKQRRIKVKLQMYSFKTFSLGVNTARDAWARNFNSNALTDNVKRMIETYNEQVFRWERRQESSANQLMTLSI